MRGVITLIALYAELSLDSIWLMWRFHDNVSSMAKPRNFVFMLLVILLFINVIFGSSFWLFFVQNCKYVVLLRFKDNKLFLNHSLTSVRTLFNLLANSVGLGLVIIKLVSSAYSTNLAQKCQISAIC